MKNVIILLSLTLLPAFGFSQKSVESTNQFSIIGLVETPKTISFSDLEKEKIETLGDIKITNHLGEFKREYKNIKGVSLLSLLNDVKIIAPNPKFLSEYYFIFKATDGYSVVVSWNELFNTEIGNTFFLIIEADNKSQKYSSEKILLIATKDFKTGRRHIKGLQSIEIKRI